MSKFIIWFSRASGVLFVTFLGLGVFVPKISASFKVVNISPEIVYCVKHAQLLNPATHECFNSERKQLQSMNITLRSDTIELIENVNYQLRLFRRGDPEGTYGYAVAKPNPANRKEITFQWNLRGPDANVMNTVVAQAGAWSVRLYVDNGCASLLGCGWSRPQEKGPVQTMNDIQIVIYESVNKNPTFQATGSIYQLNTPVEFEILNTVKGATYTIWWDRENLFSIQGVGWDTKTANQDGERLTISLVADSVSNGKKACMAILDPSSLNDLSCSDYNTTVQVKGTSVTDNGSRSRPDGNSNANPETREPYQAGAFFREIIDPRSYDIVSYCKDSEGSVGIQTGLGCIPTTPSGLTTFLLRFAIGIGGGAALLIMAFGSMQMMTAQGDPEKLNEGREKFVGALAGLLFIVFSIFLLNVIGVQIFAIPGFPR